MKRASVMIKFEPLERGVPRTLGVLHSRQPAVLFTEEIWKVIRERELISTLFYTRLYAIKDEFDELEYDTEVYDWVKQFTGEIRLEVF